MRKFPIFRGVGYRTFVVTKIIKKSNFLIYLCYSESLKAVTKWSLIMTYKGHMCSKTDHVLYFFLHFPGVGYRTKMASVTGHEKLRTHVNTCINCSILA